MKRFFVADANLDGGVNGGDLALMSGHWFRRDGLATRLDGDLNGNGWVDGGDLALLGGEWSKRTGRHGPVRPPYFPPATRPCPSRLRDAAPGCRFGPPRPRGRLRR